MGGVSALATSRACGRGPGGSEGCLRESPSVSPGGRCWGVVRCLVVGGALGCSKEGVLAGAGAWRMESSRLGSGRRRGARALGLGACVGALASAARGARWYGRPRAWRWGGPYGNGYRNLECEENLLNMRPGKWAQVKLLIAGLVLTAGMGLASPAGVWAVEKYNESASDGERATWQNLVDADVDKVVLHYTNISVAGVAGTGVATTYQFNLTTEVTSDDGPAMAKKSAAFAGTTKPTSGGILLDVVNTTVKQTMDYNKSSYIVIYYRNVTPDSMLHDTIVGAQWALEVVDKAEYENATGGAVDIRGDKTLQHKVRAYFPTSGVTLFESKLLDFEGTNGYQQGTGDYTVNQSLPAKVLVEAGAGKAEAKDMLAVRIDGFQVGRQGSDALAFVLGFTTPDTKGKWSYPTGFTGAHILFALALSIGGTLANPRIAAKDLVGAAKKDRKFGRGGDL